MSGLKEFYGMIVFGAKFLNLTESGGYWVLDISADMVSYETEMPRPRKFENDKIFRFFAR